MHPFFFYFLLAKQAAEKVVANFLQVACGAVFNFFPIFRFVNFYVFFRFTFVTLTVLTSCETEKSRYSQNTTKNLFHSYILQTN